MAAIGKRGPKPRRASPAPRNGGMRRVSPLKPGLRQARNWATAQVRAASYTRKGAMRMSAAIAAFIITIVFLGLWLGGFLPQVRQGSADFTRARLMSMGFVVDSVDVQGEGRIREDEVRAALGITPGDYLFEADMRAAQLRVQSLSWVDDAMVRRLWPNRYVVHIIERQPVALWQKKGQISVVDDEGRIIEAAAAREFYDLPLIVGQSAAAQSQRIYDALALAPSLAPQVEAIIHVGERRWNLALKGDAPLIMLPEQEMAKALARLERLHQSHGILDLNLEFIDLRVPQRLVVRPRASNNASPKRRAA